MTTFNINETIRESAMLASFHTTSWTARARDVKGASAAAQAAGADEGAYSAYRNLLYGADKRIKAVRAAQQHGRSLHLQLTLPWGSYGDERGLRMLPTASWMDYMKRMGKAKQLFTDALEDFVAHYDEDVATAMAKLNIAGPPPAGLYPPADRVKDMFTMRPEFSPIPAGTQFTGLPQSIQDRLSEEFEERVSEKMHLAINSALRRCVSQLEESAKRIQESSKVRETTWTKVQALGPMLEAFNVTGDTTVRNVSIELNRISERWDIKDLRNKEENRNNAITACRRIAEEVQEALDEREDSDVEEN